MKRITFVVEISESDHVIRPTKKLLSELKYDVQGAVSEHEKVEGCDVTCVLARYD